jgi:hypothetical protein
LTVELKEVVKVGKQTVATLSVEVHSLREELGNVQSTMSSVLDDFKDVLDGLSNRVSQLETITPGMGVQINGEPSPVSLEVIKHNVDQLASWAIEAEHSIRQNEEQFLKVKKVADKYGISA